MEYVVYVLFSAKFDKYYVGMTTNLDARVEQHNFGVTKSTKPYIPWGVVYFERYDEVKKARKREKYLKTAAGRRWRKENIRPRSSTG